MKEIRFAIPDKLWLEWMTEAGRLHIPLNLWARLRISGELAGKPTAPVQETTQERKGKPERPENGWLRERIAAEVGDRPVHKRDFPALAKKLGVAPRSVSASLQSMVNSKSKRATYDTARGVYHIVKGE